MAYSMTVKRAARIANQLDKKPSRKAYREPTQPIGYQNYRRPPIVTHSLTRAIFDGNIRRLDRDERPCWKLAFTYRNAQEHLKRKPL